MLELKRDDRQTIQEEYEVDLRVCLAVVEARAKCDAVLRIARRCGARSRTWLGIVEVEVQAPDLETMPHDDPERRPLQLRSQRTEDLVSCVDTVVSRECLKSLGLARTTSISGLTRSTAPTEAGRAGSYPCLFTTVNRHPVHGLSQLALQLEPTPTLRIRLLTAVMYADVLKRGPRRWRTKLRGDLPPGESMR